MSSILSTQQSDTKKKKKVQFGSACNTWKKTLYIFEVPQSKVHEETVSSKFLKAWCMKKHNILEVPESKVDEERVSLKFHKTRCMIPTVSQKQKSF